MANEGTIRIHRSIGGTGAAFRVTFVPYGGEGEEAAVAGERHRRYGEARLCVRRRRQICRPSQLGAIRRQLGEEGVTRGALR